tara:strand:- start:4777 stop:5187 length:411 start_codon:yes stop_codon:yes gene_type:complete
MTLFKYNSDNQDPFAGINSLLNQFSRGIQHTLSEAQKSQQIPVNLYSTEDSYEVRAELTGIDKADVSVSLNNGVLEIKAKRDTHSGTSQVEESFDRRITVGEDVDPEAVQARLEDGILSVHLPKREADKPKTITVA